MHVTRTGNLSMGLYFNWGEYDWREGPDNLQNNPSGGILHYSIGFAQLIYDITDKSVWNIRCLKIWPGTTDDYWYQYIYTDGKTYGTKAYRGITYGFANTMILLVILLLEL